MNCKLALLSFLVLTAIAQSPTWVDARHYGVVGDLVADDTAKLNAMCAALPDFSQVVFPAGMRMKITSTVTCHNKTGIRLTGLSAVGNGFGPGVNAPQFVWFGPTGGTMMQAFDVESSVIENIGFAPRSICNQDPTVTEADIGIDVDERSGPPITTDDTFRHIAINFCGTNRPSFIAIRFSNVARSNVEFMSVTHSQFDCSSTGGAGIGIQVAPSANAFAYSFEKNSFVNCQEGIQTYASFQAEKTRLSNNTIDFHLVDTQGGVSIIGSDSENSGQFLVGAGISPIYLSKNRVSAQHPPPGKAMIDWSFSYLTAVSNFFEHNATAPVFGCHAGAALLSMGNEYPDKTLASTGWSSCEFGAVSIQDKLIDPATLATWATGFTMSGTETINAGPYIPKIFPGVGVIYYNRSLKKWQVSEDGGAYVNLVP